MNRLQAFMMAGALGATLGASEGCAHSVTAQREPATPAIGLPPCPVTAPGDKRDADDNRAGPRFCNEMSPAP